MYKCFSNLDINFNISKFLPLISVMALRRAIPQFRLRFSVYQLARNRLIRILLNTPGVSPQFVEVLLNSDNEFAITGSLIVKLVTGQTWPINDIDICGTDRVPLDPQYIVHGGWDDQIHNLGIVRELWINNLFATYFEGRSKFRDQEQNYEGLKCIDQIGNFLLQDSEIKLQAMTLEKDKTVDDYVGNFDLDVCKVYFTNRKLVVKFPKTILCNLQMYVDPSVYYNVASSLSFHDPPQYFHDRLKKYRERGFNIRLADTWHKMLDNRLDLSTEYIDTVRSQWKAIIMDFNKISK